MKAVTRKIKLSFPISNEVFHPNEWRYGELTEDQVILINAKLSTIAGQAVIVAFATEDDIDKEKVKPAFVDVQPVGNEIVVILEAARSARRMNYDVNGTVPMFLKED